MKKIALFFILTTLLCKASNAQEAVVSAEKMNVVGGAFTEEVKKRFKTLKVGDIVSFLDIKTRCPGDFSARNVGTLSYIMK